MYLDLSKEGYLYLYVDRVATMNIMMDNITSSMGAQQEAEALDVAQRHSDTFRDLIALKMRFNKDLRWLLSAYLHLRKRRA